MRRYTVYIDYRMTSPASTCRATELVEATDSMAAIMIAMSRAKEYGNVLHVEFVTCHMGI